MFARIGLDFGNVCCPSALDLASQLASWEVGLIAVMLVALGLLWVASLPHAHACCGVHRHLSLSGNAFTRSQSALSGSSVSVLGGLDFYCVFCVVWEKLVSRVPVGQSQLLT